MRSERYDETVDVYSFAIVLVSMIRAEKTVLKFFTEGLKSDLGKNTESGLGLLVLNNAMHNEQFRPKLPTNFYPSLSKLIVEMWAEKAEDRPSFSAIVEKLRGDITMEVMLQGEPAFSVVDEEEEALANVKTVWSVSDSDGVVC